MGDGKREMGVQLPFRFSLLLFRRLKAFERLHRP